MSLGFNLFDDEGILDPLDALQGAPPSQQPFIDSAVFVRDDTTNTIFDNGDTPFFGGFAASPLVSGATVIYGDIDILVAASTSVEGVDSPGVKRLDYSITDASGTTVVDDRTLVDFEGDLSNLDNFLLTYKWLASSHRLSYYQLTNCGPDFGSSLTDNVMQHAWQTRVKRGADDGDEVTERTGEVGADPIALLNAEAKYPDGRYDVHVHAEAQNGNADDRSFPVIIHNYAPYVEAVSIIIACVPRYEAHWPDTLAPGSETVLQDLVTDKKEDFPAGNPWEIRLRFSEEMDPSTTPQISVQFANGDRVRIQPGSQRWSSDGRTYTLISQSDPFGGMGQIGSARLLLAEARDLAGRFMDGNPRTVAARDKNNIIRNHEDIEDTSHEIFIASLADTTLATLVSWWPAEDSGADVAGGGDVEPAGGADFGPGKIGRSFHMDSSGELFQSPGLPLWELQNFTVEGWFRGMHALSPEGEVIADPLGAFVVDKVLTDFSHDYPYNTFVLAYQPTEGRFMAIVHPLLTPAENYTDYIFGLDGSAPAGDFHHAAMTFDGGRLRLYVNGSLQAERDVIGCGLQYSTVGRLSIGGQAILNFPFRRSLVGNADEVKIYRRALSASEITGVAGVPPMQPLSAFSTGPARRDRPFSCQTLLMPKSTAPDSGPCEVAAPAEVTARMTGPGSVCVSWSPVTGQTFAPTGASSIAYRVFRSRDPDAAIWQARVTKAPGFTSYNDTGLVAGERYAYRITAIELFPPHDESPLSDSIAIVEMGAEADADATALLWWNDAALAAGTVEAEIEASLRREGLEVTPVRTRGEFTRRLGERRYDLYIIIGGDAIPDAAEGAVWERRIDMARQLIGPVIFRDRTPARIADHLLRQIRQLKELPKPAARR